MIAGRLTMRAHVQRNAATGTDGWNGPAAPDWQPLTVLPCFAWTPSSRDVVDGRKNVVAQDVRMMIAVGGDLREGDRIEKIANPAGVVLFAGPLRVEGAVEFKHNHMEAALVRAG